MKIQKVRGFRDILPPEIAKFQRIEDVSREVFERLGFDEIRTAYLEYEEVFVKSLGQDSDIVQKEMFTFADSKGRSIVLRPEGTASVVRAYIENGLYTKPGPHRFYYIGPMFRHERPQKGRFRQFYQAGIEIMGDAGPRSDAEACFVLWQIVERLGLEDVRLEVNSIGDDECRPKYREALVEYFEPKQHLLCDDCKRRLSSNPLRILDCKNEQCRAVAKDAPIMLDYLCDACRDHYEGFKRYMETVGVPFVENPRIVRGLDYYTRTAFELVSSEAGYLGVLAGGGRYDGLVEAMGGPKTPAVGFALGIDRTAEQLTNAKDDAPVVCLIPLGDEAEAFFLKKLGDLARIRARFKLGNPKRSLKKQLEWANKMCASYAIIVGEDELKENLAILRDLDAREQKKLPLDDAIKRLQR